MAEVWDAYDVDLKKLEGRTLIRGNPLPEGVFHLVCEVAVRHRDGQYLLMQRDPGKLHGGLWELTAGGSALQGETARQGAVRELWEETGIAAGNLQELGRIIDIGHHTIYVDYLCVTDCDKGSIRLQPGETVAFRWVEAAEVRQARQLLTRRMQIFLRHLQDRKEEIP